MKLDECRLIDEALVAEEACLGVLVCSYTFKAEYFEDHVLRSLLRLRCDPDEDAARYHEEARRALQETPVACFVDASAWTPGRRLPYDLHLVRARTFHPKVILVLYASEARLAVGSGNVTKSGLEQNTELFFVRQLRYDEGAHAAILREVDEFFGACAALAGAAGTQLALVREALANRVRSTPRLDSEQPVDVEFVNTFGGRLLDRLSGAIHEAAKITRVGVLAPFFERDDLGAGGDDGLHAVLAELLAIRPSPGAVLDVGAPWDDAPLAAPASTRHASLDGGVGSLWAWRRVVSVDDEPVERMEYFVVDAAATKRIQVTNAAGEGCRHDREELETEISEGRLWPVARPTVHAPATILRRIAAERSVRLRLHPTADLDPSGRARLRPLHAKALLVTTVYRGRVSTYALIGSANASRSALARGVAQGGNVEAAVLCRFDGEVTLHDLLPSLVRCSIEVADLVERESEPLPIDLSAWIDDVVHDAAAQTLRVLWRDHGPASLGPWTLRYLDREIAVGEGAPSAPTDIQSFELEPASAEVTLRSGGRDWQLPIRILDLAALPTNPLLASLGLREILALLGRRIGSERLATVRDQRGPDGVASVLEALLGEGFGPTDVFRAWWGAVEDLKTAATVAAFRQRLVGPTGLRTAWQQLRDASAEILSPDEVWVYGCELLRELRMLELVPGPDARSKQALLDGWVSELRAELDQLSPDADRHAWLGVVSRFYGLGGRDVAT